MNLDDDFVFSLTEPAPSSPRWGRRLMIAVLASLFVVLAFAWWYA